MAEGEERGDGTVNELDLIPFRTLIDRVVVPARRHLRTTLLPVALPVMAGSLAVALAQIAWFDVMLDPDPDPDAAAAFLGAGCAFMGLSFLMLAVYGLAFAALTVAAVDAVASRPVSMGRAWAFVVQPRVLLGLVLLGLAYFGSTMMCLVPALYVVPLLAFVVPAMADEGLTAGAAFRRSVELMHWNPTRRFGRSPWLQTFLLMLVGLIVNYAANLLVQLPFVLAQQVLMLRQTFSGEAATMEEMVSVLWLQVPAVVLGSVATAVAWLYTAFGLAILFREVRRRKEAPDLEEAVDELTGAAAVP